MPRTAAVVGTAGGVGATRLAVESAASLAAAGRDAAVVDVAFATQGLARHVDGRIDADTAALLADSARPAADAAHELDIDTPGSVTLYPTYAPFTTLASASAPNAAATLGDRLDELDADHVLVDTPPVLANPAIASVDAADAVALVAPGGERGADAVARTRGRLADVDASADLLVANRAPDTPLDADVAIPTADAADTERFAYETPRAPFSLAVGELAEALFDVDLALPDEPGLVDRAKTALK
ncbi:ParA family protein [Halocalculus aciditolerans]|uniref:ParA family protein n=1 Tax=Halocalculus aciditolerans TaxID=1383812 RepID=A0A830FFJ4_9EURY|nr:ParA family protein [Halocalculus aciditolerans]GGL48220.1 hypothetical protein GCM10009039_03060 [Halocalculus aciditolerans]